MPVFPCASWRHVSLSIFRYAWILHRHCHSCSIAHIRMTLHERRQGTRTRSRPWRAATANHHVMLKSYPPLPTALSCLWLFIGRPPHPRRAITQTASLALSTAPLRRQYLADATVHRRSAISYIFLQFWQFLVLITYLLSRNLDFWCLPLMYHESGPYRQTCDV